MSDIAGQYLTFYLDEEEYGIEILKVQEIIAVMPITPVPQAASFVRGVINLRGKIIPVVDLREKLGMKSKDPTRNTCIVVVEVAVGTLGVIVDRVNEVVQVEEEALEPTPDLGEDMDTSFLLGMARTPEGVRLLLKIESVMAEVENNQGLALPRVAERGAA